VIADSGGYGTHVVINHIINGQKVQSTYAHMIVGSPMVTVGQAVAVGQPLGLVGSTGASTGAHLHLGITVNGSFVDPFAWLKANAR
jgi:murein DD-endopeptidase MepM/ murein hydrolase activator NlpD